MGAPIIADRVAELVEELTSKVIDSLGAPPAHALHIDGVRHILRLKLGKVVADYLLSAATAKTR
jgi:hypothetical protein